MADAYEDAHDIDIKIGKAAQGLYCPECGESLYAVPREKDYVWNCGNIMGCDYRRTEPKKVIK